MTTPENTAPPAVDPAVKVPDHVAAQAAAADAAHKAAYATPEPQASVPSVPSVASPGPAPPPEQKAPDKTAEWTAEQARHAYLSMKGRYEQAAQSIGALQEQMTEMGDELIRTQQAAQRSRTQPVRQGTPPPQLITDKDVETYGHDVLDMVVRAARQAVMPDLQKINNGVRQVHSEVQRTRTETVYDTLDREIPDWQAINVSPRFKTWCGLRDIYSGQLRGKMLNDALQAADAPRAVAFFKGFLQEEVATGALPDTPDQPQYAAARTPAMTLDSLVAPGRAKPASGNEPTPVDKPIFTRNQIAAFYRAVREGHFAGRDQEKNTTEQAIFLAQREGRVR